MVVFPLSAAGRDEQAFENAKEFELDRGLARHFSFGAGPHRCLGSHLARQELVVALDVWHRLVPDYRLDESTPVIEHAGGVYGLDTLPLEWDR
jgi:cytochrome P450